MNIILVGAWGTGISSLGFLLSDLWYTNIIGIDANKSQITQSLEAAGIHMIIWHGDYQVQPGDVVIYSDACPTAPEVQQARDIHTTGAKHAQLPYRYFQFLGEVSKYFQTIAIAGTHGKSTTTALLTNTMKEIDASFALGILGALVPQLDQKNYRARIGSTTQNDISNDTKNEIDNKEINYVYTNSIRWDLQKIFMYILFWKNIERDESLRKKYRFVIEADEFNRHFLYLDTDYAIILNAELDHSDIYPNEEVYLDTFVEFINKVKHKTFVLQGEPGIDYLMTQCPHLIEIQKQSIELSYIFGDHNQKNSSLLLALLEEIGKGLYTKEHIVEAMKWFRWLWRRMELLQELPSGALLYSDYGHHPTEIHAVYEAMREKYPTKKLIAIFQPHQARRVLQFWEQFTDTMKQFDETIIYNIYVARENLEELLQEYPIPDHQDGHLTSIDQLGDLFAQKSNATYTKEFQTVLDRINTANENEVVCVFTAGNLDFMLRKEFGE